MPNDLKLTMRLALENGQFILQAKGSERQWKSFTGAVKDSTQATKRQATATDRAAAAQRRATAAARQ